MSNEKEVADIIAERRRNKVDRMVEVMQAHKLSARDAMMTDIAYWDQLAKALSINPLSADSRRMVIGELACREIQAEIDKKNKKKVKSK